MTLAVDAIQRQDVLDLSQRYTLDGITRDAVVFVFHEVSPLPAAETRQDPAIARATVAGTVARLEVAAGDTVAKGQTLAIV